MIPSTSQRLPRKTCGLFDTGFAGDAADVASLGLGVDGDIDQSFFTFGDPGPSTSQEPANDATKFNIPETVDSTLDDWNFDLLDPLGGLEDPLADLEDPLGDSRLDAFIDLESLLGENSFGESSQMKVETAEVEPVISFDAAVSDSFLVPEAVTSTQVVKPIRKRKAVVSNLDDNLFKIPDPMTYGASDSDDHNYITKSPMSLSERANNKTKVFGKGKTTLKRKRVASTTSDCSEVSSTSSSFEADEQVDGLDKQSIRRIKNNIASKRSREQRKQKFVDMDNEAEELEKANDALRNKIVELEKRAKEMKELLVAKMSGKA